jgi:TonB family protein
MAGKRLLLVDYDPTNLNHARKILESAGFEVSTCADGLSAVELVKSLSPDIVLLSAMLPKMHGFEACAAIRKLPNGSKIPIVIITDVYKGKRYRLDALGKYGATEYIEKPIEDAALVAMLQNLSKSPVVAAVGPSEEGFAELDERTVQFNRDDLMAQMGKKVPQAAPAAKPVPEKKSAADKSKDDIARKLEESLAGLDLNLTKKAKPKPKPAPAQPTATPAPSPIVEKAPEPPAEEVQSAPSEPAATSGSQDEVAFTSEDLFTDIIESVERELQSTSFTPKSSPDQQGTSPMPAISSSPTVAMQSEDVSKKMEEFSADFDSILEKKLTSTLSGLRKEVAAASAKTPPPPTAPTPDAGTGATVQLSREAVKEALGEELEEDSEKGINFGQYLLLEKIATGGMAELFKAKRKGVEGFEKILAIKRILPHMSDNDEFITMFIDEAKLAAQLTHQNICQIFDLGKIENSYYIAMEYVHGKDLRAALRASRSKKKPFPVELAILVISKISSALDYAHRKRDANGQPLNLVHRDISPQNILISYEGEVKLVDFGIAKAATKAHVTQHGALKGKLLYMSPEQAWGKAVDKRTDNFSLGVVLYEMLTGAPLFLSETDTEVTILEKVREAKVGPVRELNPKVPEALEKIITKALHKNPDERYQTAQDLQKDLDNLFYSEGYNATSGSLAQFLQSLFPEEWGKEGGGKETVVIEKEISQALLSSLGDVPEKSKEEPAPVSVVAPELVGTEKPKRDGRIKIVPTAEKRIEPQGASAKQQEPEAAEPVKAPITSIPPEIQIPAPELAIPPQKSKLMTYVGIIAAVVVIGIIAAFLFRSKPGQEAPKSEPQPVQTPAQNQPQNQPEAKSATPTPVQPPPVTAPPVETKDNKQQKIDDLQKKVQEQEKKVADKKAEEEKQKEDAKKKAEAAQAEEKQNPPTSQPEVKTEPANPPAEEQQADAKTPEVIPPTPLDQQQQEPQQTPEQTAPPAQEPAAKEADQPPGQQAEAAKQETEAPAKPEIQEGQLVDLTPDVSKPVIVNRINPTYPPVAAAKKVQGTVLVSVLVSETGQVAEVKVLRGAGGSTGLNEAAVSAIKKWKFQPAVKDGKRVKVWVTYPIVFKLQ